MDEFMVLLHRLVLSKKFVTRGGLPFAKKMWRDGYNKALDEILNYFLMLEQDKAEAQKLSPA